MNSSPVTSDTNTLKELRKCPQIRKWEHIQK